MAKKYRAEDWRYPVVQESYTKEELGQLLDDSHEEIYTRNEYIQKLENTIRLLKDDERNAEVKELLRENLHYKVALGERDERISLLEKEVSQLELKLKTVSNPASQLGELLAVTSKRDKYKN